ncbi:hypothetical protein PDIDSM_85 [Penicillium digitatum]|nr:hypothetical protein PDIDSM_85 [Penicillium digitatum]
MASELLYIFCAGCQVWVAQEGEKRRSSTTSQSARPILSSPLEPRPRLRSQSQLCLTRHDNDQYKTQPSRLWSTATLVSNLCPTRRPHNLSSVAYDPNQPGKFIFTVRLTTILRSLSDNSYCVPTLRNPAGIPLAQGTHGHD